MPLLRLLIRLCKTLLLLLSLSGCQSQLCEVAVSMGQGCEGTWSMTVYSIPSERLWNAVPEGVLPGMVLGPGL